MGDDLLHRGHRADRRGHVERSLGPVLRIEPEVLDQPGGPRAAAGKVEAVIDPASWSPRNDRGPEALHAQTGGAHHAEAGNDDPFAARKAAHCAACNTGWFSSRARSRTSSYSISPSISRRRSSGT